MNLVGVLLLALMRQVAVEGVGQPFRVLCFGGSLTMGILLDEQGQWQFHPYSERLRTLLTDHLKDRDVTVALDGMRGELLLPHPAIPLAHVPSNIPPMIERLPKVLADANATGVPYHWAIIMGGLFDIALGRRAGHVFEGLRGMYEACKDHGVKVVALTLMQSETFAQQGGLNQLNVEREEVNTLLKEYVRRTKEVGLHEIKLLDLYDHLDWSKLSKEERGKMWGHNGQHLSRAGYDAMADLLFQTLIANP